MKDKGEYNGVMDNVASVFPILLHLLNDNLQYFLFDESVTSPSHDYSDHE